MPCAGPTEAEVRAMDRAANRRRIGKSWTDEEWTENVACAYTAYVRHKTPLPEWAVKWSDIHEEKDRQRKQAEKNRAEEAREDKFKQLQRLKKELGVK